MTIIVPTNKSVRFLKGILLYPSIQYSHDTRVKGVFYKNMVELLYRGALKLF